MMRVLSKVTRVVFNLFSLGSELMAATPMREARQIASERRCPMFGTISWLILVLAVLTASPVAAQEVVEYYAVDAVGSIRVVFDATGNVKARSDYLPFGEEATASGLLPSQRFTGQERDHEESLDNFNARRYQTRTGRMTSVDPVFSALFQPQAWNRYAYALNNPLAYIDPDGRDPIKPDFKIEVVAGDPTAGFMAQWLSTYWALTGGDYTSTGLMSVSQYLYEDWASRPSGSGADWIYEAGQIGATQSTSAHADEGAALDGSEIPACPGCLPYTGEPDKFVSDDFVSDFVNGGGVSLGGVLKAGVFKGTVGGFTMTKTVFKHATEVITNGPFKGELLRPYMTSELVLREIMAAGKAVPDPRGAAGALRWDVPGTFRGAVGTWELVIQKDVILHYNFVGK